MTDPTPAPASQTYSISAKGSGSQVLESVETQLGAIYKNMEETKAKEAPLIRSHLSAMFHFLTQKLSSIGSAAHVSVTAIGSKVEDKAHQLQLTIKHVDPPEAPKPAEPEAPSAPANS